MSRVRLLLALLASTPVIALSATPAITAPAPVGDRVMAALAGRLFPALTSMEGHEVDRKVGAMLAERRKRIAACGADADCLIRAALWTEQERSMLADHAAGASTPSDDGVRPQLLRELAGINHILQVYGQGVAPRYPEIDGPGDQEGLRRFLTLRQSAVTLSNAMERDPVGRLDPGIRLALALLDANDQDVAAAFEPLDTRTNAEAAARAKTIDWSRYRYTAIIVTGVGPTDLDTPLSAAGKLNVRMAAERFADGLAPFIILSGSMVHPRGTRHVEALEMRSALIERFGIPADAIILEPYARHTTTNLRNATRRLIALGAPLDRDTLIVTNAEQSAYIEGPEFAARNLRELGYQPGTVGKRLSPVELSFRPGIASTRVDPMDPLDP